MSDKKSIGQLSQEAIDKLKAEPANKDGIYGIEVGGHIGYFRNPTRRDINIAASQLDADNPMDYFETLMTGTFVGGSRAIIEDDKLYLGSIQVIKKKADGQKAVLVNL